MALTLTEPPSNQRRDGSSPGWSPTATPLHAEDLAGLPPTFIDVGTADLRRDENLASAPPRGVLRAAQGAQRSARSDRRRREQW